MMEIIIIDSSDFLKVRCCEFFYNINGLCGLFGSNFLKINRELDVFFRFI